MSNLYKQLELFRVKNKVSPIRPKILLKIIEELDSSPTELNLLIPSSEIGSLTTLEATMMVTLLKILQPNKIFEFGTFLGYSTSVFLKNTSEKCEVFSLDLGDDISYYSENKEINRDEILKNDCVNDDFLRLIQSNLGPRYLLNYINDGCERLKLLKGDSLNFDFEGYHKSIDFIFIDGGHLYDIVKKDTINAMKMLKKDGIIVWHDYNSKLHGDVSILVDQLANENQIFFIENTMLAFYINF